MSQEDRKYRLVTRCDFDGLVSAVLLRHLKLVDDIRFLEPREVQEGRGDLTGNDITTNLPFAEGVHLAFEHHASEAARGEPPRENRVIDPKAPSTARVVYDHFGGKDCFPEIWDEMLAAVDKSDSGNFSIDEVLHPEGWALLNFLIDSRTGLERFGSFRLSDNALMLELIEHFSNRSIDEMFAIPDIKERVYVYFEHEKDFKAQIQRCAQSRGDLLVLDMRGEEQIYPGNRFMVYALYPECKFSARVTDLPGTERTHFAVGKSVFNRGGKTNIGALMRQYGGGGHENAGTCEADRSAAERVLDELIERIGN